MTAVQLAIGQGYLTVKEVEAIKEVVRLLPVNAIGVNIGSGMATSTIAILEEQTEITLYDVDIDLTHGAQQLSEHGYDADPRLKRIQGDSGIVGLTFQDQIDYLFVDGDHTESGILADCVAWLKHVKAGGYVLFHDYWPYPDDHALAGVDYWPAVRKVVDEVLHDATVVMDVVRIRVYRL